MLINNSKKKTQSGVEATNSSASNGWEDHISENRGTRWGEEYTRAPQISRPLPRWAQAV